MIKDTNPAHYKVDGANFVEYMNDPKISGFGDWMFANGFNSGVWASSNWISVKDRLPEKNKPVLWFVTLKDRGMGHIRLGTFEGTVNHEIPEVSCCGPNAIPGYWIPLPEPPKEES